MMRGWLTMDEPRPVAMSVDRLRRQMGLAALDTFAVIASEWGDIVGERLASGTEPERLKDGVLTVRADDGPTAELMKWACGGVRDQLSERFPDETIESVVVRVRARP
jgi:hypothetical protein